MPLDRCPNCPREHDPIPGCGPEPCDLLFLGERPGKRENERHRVFVGPTGEEKDNTYLPLARLRRSDVAIQNVVRCWAFGNRTPTETEVMSCARHFLPRVFDRVKPKVVVLLGGSAHKLVDRVVGKRPVRVDMIHGRPFQGSLLGGMWEGWIWSSYHPALGMHDTAKMSDLLEDYEMLGKWLRGEWEPPVPPPQEERDYGLVESSRSLSDYLRDQLLRQRGRLSGRGDRSERRVYLYTDTERHGSAPWSAQFSLNPGSARLLRYHAVDSASRALFVVVQEFICETRAEVVLHNAGQDLDALEKMGVEAPLFSDTMQEAFQLCTLPQGLKALVFRTLGVEMRSWEDVVWPASVEAMGEWIVEAMTLAGEEFADVETTEMVTFSCEDCRHKAHSHKKDGVCRSKAGGGDCRCVSTSAGTNMKYERRPGAVEKVLRHILQHTMRTTEEDKPYNPWRKLKEMRGTGLRGAVAEAWEWEALEARVGVPPLLGIGNCELGAAVEYGCDDANYEGQIAERLVVERGADRWKVDREDWDR